IEAYGYAGAKGIYAASDNATTVTNSGDISAEAGLFVEAVDYYGYSLGYVNGGTAIGIQATGGEAGTTVDNSGAIAVNAGYATGIEAQSYGDTTVTNSGNNVAGSGLGSYYDNGTGYTYYYGTQVATGINAGSNGAGAAVTVTSSGDIAADGIFGATGIAATATGEGGTATIASSGNVYASVNQKYGYGAYGLVASADADATVTNDGGLIDVYSAGAATGAAALSFAGDASVTNSGDIAVESTAGLYYAASGIVAFANYGEAHVDNTGSVSANAEKYVARAVDAQGLYGASVENSGRLYANGKYAYGVFASSGMGDVSVANAGSGDIEFYSYLGSGFGVLGVATQGDVGVDNAGTIEGYAFGQAAGVFGLAYAGDVNVANSGSIDVTSGGNVAVGVFARADHGTASVSNSGDITASDFPGGYYTGYSAYGLFANGMYVDASNSGDIVADGYYYATGIAARSYSGTAVNNSAGTVEASADLVAIGIEGRSEDGNVAVNNASAITAEAAYGGGVGIQAYSGGGNVVV